MTLGNIEHCCLSLGINKPLAKQKEKLISGRVDIAYAIETVNSGSITGRVKPKIKKLVLTASHLKFSTIRDSVKLSPCVVTGGSLT